MAFKTTRNFVAVTVTLATANTNYNLKSLVDAILAAESNTDTAIVCQGAPKFYSIQSYPGIDTVGANANDILVGDAKLSTTRIGKILAAAGGILSDSAPINNCDFGDLYAQSAGTAQKVNILLAAG